MLLTSNPKQKIDRERIVDRPSLQFYEKGDEIPLLQPGFWQIYRGVVQLSRISDRGEEIILGWATEESFFGQLWDNASTHRAQALSNLYVKWFSLKDIKSSPNLARNCITQYSQRLVKTQQLLTITGLRRVEERLWELLLFLKQDMGEKVTRGTRLGVRFTHQNLADVIGTTRVTVTRILGLFRSRGSIDFDSDRHIIVIEENSF